MEPSMSHDIQGKLRWFVAYDREWYTLPALGDNLIKLHSLSQSHSSRAFHTFALVSSPVAFSPSFVLLLYDVDEDDY